MYFRYKIKLRVIDEQIQTPLFFSTGKQTRCSTSHVLKFLKVMIRSSVELNNIYNYFRIDIHKLFTLI